MGTKTPEWSDKDTHRLFLGIKANICPEDEMKAFHNGMKMIDWKLVAFPPYSAAECKHKWTFVARKMRKARNLKEVTEEAKDGLAKANPLYWKKHKLLLQEHQKKVANLRDEIHQASCSEKGSEKTPE